MRYSNEIFFIKILICMSLIFSKSSFASLSDSFLEPLSEQNDSAQVVSAPMDGVLLLDGHYKFLEISEILPYSVILNGEEEENFNNYLIEMSVNEPVVIEFLPDNMVLMTLSLHDEEQGIFPDQLILTLQEFSSLEMDFIGPGDVAELYEKDFGYKESDNASVRGHTFKPRRHKVKSFSLDRNGRIVGRNGNCVAVVKYLTGFVGRAGDGKGFANALLSWRGKGYKTVKYSERKKGTVCSWTGGWHGKGHVGWFDGKCFQPTYKSNCGDPGSRYRMRKCVST